MVKSHSMGQEGDPRGAAVSRRAEGHRAPAAKKTRPRRQEGRAGNRPAQGDRLSQQPEVSLLVSAVHARLHDLGISQLAASKMGKLSRSTLATLGKGGKIPSDSTLDKLDELLSWEPGSARGILVGETPVPREDAPRPPRPEPPQYEPAGYASLAHEIDQRLRELNMSKTKFAAIGGPGRSTLHTLGRRGYAPQPDTLNKIDRFLLWEPGSAETVLQGGLPIRRGPTPTPHPALVPLNAVLDRQRRLLAQLTHWEQSIAQMKNELTESINHVNVAITDLKDWRRRDVLTVIPGTSGDGDADRGEGAM